ncbi:MAG: alpha/beta fold hydrolase [Elainellaceae cyanobacterium]
MIIPPGFESRSLSTSLGEMVYYTQSPDGWFASAVDAPALLFLHGFGGGSSAYEWSKVYPAFAAQYRVAAPDLIGWGQSAHPERRYTIDDYVTTITEFVEQVGDRPSWVVASALTAAFTIRAAIARPELFKGLILTTASGLRELDPNFQDSFFTKLIDTPVIDGVLYRTAIANSFGIRSFLEQRQFAEPKRVYDEIVDAYLASAQQPNGEYAALSFVRGDLSFDLTEHIGELKTPTALIWGREAKYTGPEVGQRLIEANPEAIRVMYQLDDVGLTPQLELPAVTCGLIRRCLQQISISPPPQADPSPQSP